MALCSDLSVAPRGETELETALCSDLSVATRVKRMCLSSSRPFQALDLPPKTGGHSHFRKNAHRAFPPSQITLSGQEGQ